MRLPALSARLIAIGAMALAIAGLIVWLWPQDRPAPVAAAARQATPFPFVRSLEGTSPDANLRVDEHQALVVDAALGRLFDYYLAAQGEQSLPAIRAEIEAELRRRLQPSAAAEAIRLLGRYLDYKQALVTVESTLQKSASSAHAARDRLLAMQQTRARFFSPQESAGLFGFEDAYNSDAVARMEISQNPALNEIQKTQQFAALDAQLPPALRAARDAPLQVVRLEEEVSKVRKQGGSDDEVYRLRASTLTPEAAARLSEVDRDEAQWKQRIEAYLGERKVLQARSAASPTEQVAALQQLRESRFTAEELPRLVAYEQ